MQVPERAAQKVEATRQGRAFDPRGAGAMHEMEANGESFVNYFQLFTYKIHLAERQVLSPTLLPDQSEYTARGHAGDKEGVPQAAESGGGHHGPV